MENKLPADPSALILGIVGLVIGIAGCCCYGFTAIIPLALSIVGLVSANKSLKLYKENPSGFTESSRSNVSIGKVLNIISIVINGIFLLVVIGFIAFIGVAGFQGFFDEVRRNAGIESSNDWEYNETYEDDGNWNSQSMDSLDRIETPYPDDNQTDSIFIEEMTPELDTLN